MNRGRIVTVALLLAALLIGCSTSELIDIWSSSSAQYPPVQKVLVIAAGTNRTQRRIWEDAFCIELARHYVSAAPSYRTFPDALPDTEQVVQSVRTSGYDAVLVVRKLPSESIAEYTGGYTTSEQTMRYDHHRSRFFTYYREVQHAGYIDSQKVSLHSIDLWSIKEDGMMIWSATSKTMEPNAGAGVRTEIAKLVMGELTSRGIIGSRR